MDVNELHNKVNFEHSCKDVRISRILAEQMGYGLLVHNTHATRLTINAVC